MSKTITKKSTTKERNPVVMIARTRNAGYLRDRRFRRAKDRLNREMQEIMQLRA